MTYADRARSFIASPRIPVGNVDDVRDVAAELHRRGVDLRIEDGLLRWSAAPGAMDVVLLRRIKHLEPELISLLGGDGER